MKRLLLLFFASLTIAASAQPGGPAAPASRVVHVDASKARTSPKVHDGAGTMAFGQMFGSAQMKTDFLYLHAGELHANSSIGEHFHHTIEEMYVLLDGEAEFTINGRTAKIQAPALVPCKMGDAHAVYNTSGKTSRWMNWGVSKNKGRSDAFNLGDPRTPGSTTLDAIPQFVYGRLEREKLRPNNPNYTGTGVIARRIFGPEVFKTNWDHVDHVVIPAGTTMGERTMDGFEDAYYVVNGTGAVTLAGKKSPIVAADAFYGLLGEKVAIANDGKEDLELLIISVAVDKSKMPVPQRTFGAVGGAPGANAVGATGAVGAGATTVAALQPKAMALQMDFVVEKKNADAFEKMYSNIYIPAMRAQVGYLSSKLLRIFPADIEKKIEGETTTYNYQLQLSFDTEANRQKWVASTEHVKTAWPAATSLAKSYKWRGYDVMGDDDVKK